MRKITEAIVHCTATRPEWWASKTTSQKVKEIRRWHVEDRGWSDIGYHFLIDRDGTIAEGRSMDRDGAHVQGHNKGTIGISLFGGHGSSENDPFEANFTPEQDRALRGLLVKLQNIHGFTKVSGHNEYAAKACPGFNVRRWLSAKSPERASLFSSTTLQAAGVTGGATFTGAAAVIGQLDRTAQIIVVVAGVVIALGLVWIVRERVKKWAAGVK